LERLDPLTKKCSDLQHPVAVAVSTLVGDKNHRVLNREVISITLPDDSLEACRRCGSREESLLAILLKGFASDEFKILIPNIQKTAAARRENPLT